MPRILLHLQACLQKHARPRPLPSTGQLALAWVLSRGEDVVPIPGSRRVKHLLENLGAAGLHLTHHELAILEEAMPASQVGGGAGDWGAVPGAFAYLPAFVLIV
jgi:aryl-alcohol dehydrogenase-like predicted oxidoreductase